jgi:hypothetical protein
MPTNENISVSDQGIAPPTKKCIIATGAISEF